MRYLYIIEKANNGSYSAHVPDRPGCTSCGDTVDDVQTNIKNAVDSYIGLLREYGDPVPEPTSDAGSVEAAQGPSRTCPGTVPHAWLIAV